MAAGPVRRALTNSIGNSVIVDPAFDWEDGDFKMPPWNELVIYEMHVGTFHVKEQGKPGTFLTAIEKLDYLRGSGHQRDRGHAADGVPRRLLVGLQRRAIRLPSKPRTAARTALKQFVNEAHKRGIAVLLDVVYNHVGPNDNALWQFDGWSENGGGGIYFYNDWRAETPWGDTRPDYGRGEVRQYFRDNALMWLEEYHCDGLRFDATAFIRHVHGNDPASDPERELPEGWGFLRWINEEIQARQPWKFTIAEDLKGDGVADARTWARAAAASARNGTRSSSASSGAPSSAWPTSTATWTRSQTRSRPCWATTPFDRVIFTESHDEDANGKARVPEEISPGDSRELVSEEAFDPRRRAGDDRARRADDLPGPGDARRPVVPRAGPAGLVALRGPQGHSADVHGPVQAAAQLAEQHRGADRRRTSRSTT